MTMTPETCFVLSVQPLILEPGTRKRAYSMDKHPFIVIGAEIRVSGWKALHMQY